MQRYEKNNLILYLFEKFGIEVVNAAISRYFVGTSKHRNGATVFWQIDLQGKIRAGKIIVYGMDGRRRKDILPKVQWVHSILKLQNFSLAQCFFGEHLLAEKGKPVAIVESEKTAVIASICKPKAIWLACGGSEGLNNDKCRCLYGRKVILYILMQESLTNGTKKQKNYQNFATFPYHL